MIFTVPGKIRGKGRPRFTKSGHAYTDEKTREYEDLIRCRYKDEGGILFPTVVGVRVTACFAIPKNATKKKRWLMAENIIRPTKKPDIDNIVKVVLDALNGIAYADDKFVVFIAGEKAYSSSIEYLIIEVAPAE